MDILDLIFRVRTTELDAANAKLDKTAEKAEKAESKAKGLSDALGGFSKLGGPIGNVADRVGDLSDKADTAATSFGKVGGAVVGVTVAAAAAVAGAVNLTLAVADAADALNDMSNRTNISTERLSLLDAMAKMAGSNVDELASSSEKLGMKLAKQDEESGKAVTALKSLGISTKEANGETKSMLQLQEEVVLAVDKATDKAKAEGAALMILGTDYYKLRTAIKETAEQKSEMYDYMQKVGAVVTTKLAKDSDTLNDNIGKLGLSFKGMGISIANITVPILNTVITKLGAISEKAADIMRRWSGGTTASEASGDALTELQGKRDAAMATIKRMEGTAYATTPQGERSLADERAKVTAINDQIREMGRLKQAADNAAASVKAAVTDGKTGEGNRASGGTGGSSGSKVKDDPLSWMKEGGYSADLNTAQVRANERNKEYDAATEAGNKNAIDYADSLRKQNAEFQKQADAVRDLLDPTRELQRQIEAVNNNPLLADDEKAAAIIGFQLKYSNSMNKMKDDTSEFNKMGDLAFNTFSGLLSDLATGAEVSAESIGRAFLKAAVDIMFLQPALEGIKKSMNSLGGGSGIVSLIGTGLSALFGGGRASGGHVSAGGLYQINEEGRPETLSSGGKEYLMMGNKSGVVRSAGANGSGGGGGVVVQQLTVEVIVQGGGSNAREDGRIAGEAAGVAAVNKLIDARIIAHKNNGTI